MKRLHNRALSLKQMMMSGVLALAVLLAGIFALPTLAPSADNVVGTNVGLSGDDNGKNNFPIGFTFKYWGIDYTTFGVSINGWVSLKNTASGAYGNPDFPMSDSVLDGLIAPFFDDIRTDVEGQPEGIIFYLTIGQEPNRILVIQWNDMYFYGSNLPMGTFEVLLYESTNEIKFQYRYLRDERSSGNQATIGMDKPEGEEYIRYSFNENSLAEQKAIQFTPNAQGGYTMNSNAPYSWLDISGLTSLPPEDEGEYSKSESIRFTWQPTAVANAYRIDIATASDEQSIIKSVSLGNVTEYTYSENVTEDTTYYARVAASLNNGGTYQNPSLFSDGITIDKTPPVMSKPTISGGSEITKAEFQFSATDKHGIASYHIQIASDESFNNLLAETEIEVSGKYSYEGTLGQTLYAKAYTIDKAGNKSEYSISSDPFKITALNADFIGDPVSGGVPLTVNFTDKSEGNPTSWKWDFNNDGTIDSEVQNPAWTYEQAGTYTVALSIGNGTETDTETKTDYISVKEADLNDGLVAYYPFNSNANDESGNEIHGTEYGDLVYIDGVNGKAAKFDGVNDYINVKANPLLNPVNQLTLAFWIRIDGITNFWSPIIHKGGSALSGFANREYTVWLNSQKNFHLASAGNNSSQHTYDTSTQPVDTWIFYAAVIDRKNNVVKVYINDLLNIESDDQYSSFNNNDNDLRFGWTEEIGGSYSPFNGVLDELRIYNRALSEAEIQALYQQNKTLQAEFIADKITGNAPLNVQFTDKSIGHPTSWKWDFNNDGVIDSEEQNPTWKYEQIGTYTVSLTVSDGTSQNTKTNTDYITVTAPQANLAASALKIPNSATSLIQPEISWQVQNTAEGTAGEIKDSLYISSDNILDENDILLGEFTRTDGLNADTDYWRTEKIQIPNDLAAGSYYVIVKTDSSGAINETDENDNISVQPITIAKAKLMTATPDRIPLNLNPGVPVTGKIEIGNITGNALSGVDYTVQNAAANITVQLSDVPTELESMTSQELTYTVTANDLSVSESEATLVFTGSQGAIASITFEISVIPGQPRLIANPGYLEYGMLRGRQTTYEFELSNTGGASADNLQVLVPEATWLKLVTPANIGTLAPGGKVKIGLMLTPPENMVLGPYAGEMMIRGSNTGIRVSFRFIAVSEAKGSLKITATDEFTYFAEDHPNVAGAKVSVKDSFSDKVVAEGVTDEKGVFSAENINEGRYDIEVSAEKHGTYRNTIEIVPGTVKDIEAFLARQLVTYRWSVEPVEIEDHYTVTLEAVFETHVPAPVVTIEPPFNFVPLFEGETTTIEVTLTNHGLIAAQGVTFHPFENDRLYAEPEIQNIGTLDAMTSVTIPVKVRAKADTGSKIRQAEEPDAECLSLCADWYYYCGEKRTNHACIMLKVVMDILGKLSALADPVEAGLVAAETILPKIGAKPEEVQAITDTIRLIRDSIKCATIVTGNVGAITDCLSAACGAVKEYNKFVNDTKDKFNLEPVPEDVGKCLCAISSVVNLAGAEPGLSTIPDAGSTATDIAECLCSLKLSPVVSTGGGGGGYCWDCGWTGGISGPGGYIELKDPCK